MKRITINKEIYSVNTIESAIADYKGIAKISYKVYDNQVELSFSKCKYNEEQTIKEFENYMIGLENI